MKKIISASRRTDIPAFYMDWFVNGIRNGFVEVENPFNRKKYKVSLVSEEVGVIVLWSKDFHNFFSVRNEFMNYNLFFQFTINDCSFLEPELRCVDIRLEQLEKIVRVYGAEVVSWRFDPIVFWKNGKNNNLGSFKRIAEKAAALGIKRCITSFATYYQKARNRMKNSGIQFFDPRIEQKQEILSKMSDVSASLGIELSLCCQPDYLIEGVKAAKCIDAQLLSLLFNLKLSKAKASGQRKDCCCSSSRDIGSYSQLCPHGCLYCYANK
ncbi:DUF1848 family protein [bacterium]|nr:DUF1848 family protein [bacterium]